MKRLLPFLLIALPAFAQTPVTVANPSFEQFNALNGTHNNGPIPKWVLTGTGGSYQPPASSGLGPSCDATPTVAYLNNGATLSQDLGTLTPGSYSISVCMGNRPGYAGSVAVAFGSCSQNFDVTKIPSGQYQNETMSCTLINSGDTTLIFTSTGAQNEIDDVVITFTSAGPPPPPVTLNIVTKVVFCKVCDRTDDTPAQGNLIFTQGQAVNSFGFASDGSVAVNVSFDMSRDPVVFTTLIQNASGQQANGSGWTWTIPRASFAAGLSTLGTLSFGGVAFTVNSDGTLSFAGFLPT